MNNQKGNAVAIASAKGAAGGSLRDRRLLQPLEPDDNDREFDLDDGEIDFEVHEESADNT